MTGSGTLLDPYIIYDVDDLQAMKDDLAAYYELANDIDASATVGWNAGAGFDPVGPGAAVEDRFTGQLDGKGYKISDLFINRPAENAGLFGYVYTGGVVKNLGLEGCDITGLRAGALVRHNRGTITDCYTTGSVAGASGAGGLSENSAGTISKCYSECTVAASGGPGAGFVRYNGSGGTIDECYSLGDVTSGSFYDVGGFVDNNYGDISNCYSIGSATCTGTGDVAGFCERNDGNITNCYSIGSASTTAPGDEAGFCTDNNGTITNCFWDTETSGQPLSDGGTGKTTAEMKTKATFTDEGWDLLTIWGMFGYCNDGYACLRNVTPSCLAKQQAGLNPALVEILTGA